MFRKISLSLLLLSAAFELKAQIGGEGIMPIMNLPLHARTMAWGGYNLAQPLSDVQFALDNPGMLNGQCHGQFGGSFGTVMPGVRIGGAGYAHTISKGNHVSIHAQYLDYGKMKAFDPGGNPEGTITANEMKFVLGYSREFSSRWVIGAQTGFTYAVLGPFVSTAAMINLGATYSRSDSGVHWGLSIKNMGLQLINYRGSEKESLPFNIAFGASYKPLHMPFRFHATLHSLQNFMGLTYDQFTESTQTDLGGNTIPNKEANIANKITRHIALGGELVMGKHLGILIGYNHQRRMEMSPAVRTGLTGFGWGVRMKIWKYHLTYSSVSLFPGQNTNTFSLSLIPGFYQ